MHQAQSCINEDCARIHGFIVYCSKNEWPIILYYKVNWMVTVFLLNWYLLSVYVPNRFVMRFSELVLQYFSISATIIAQVIFPGPQRFGCFSFNVCFVIIANNDRFHPHFLISHPLLAHKISYFLRRSLAPQKTHNRIIPKTIQLRNIHNERVQNHFTFPKRNT